jgi:hypothetical protein
MSFFSWLRSRTSTRVLRDGAQHRPATRHFRPRLEALEDRFLPSTITVTSADDGFVFGKSTLRSAIDAAHPGDTINFAPSLDGQTIYLSPNQGGLSITKPLTIEGPGAGLLAISGYISKSRVFDVGFNSVTSMQATLSGLTIENGSSISGASVDPNPGAGGGIYNTADLTVNDCTITNNMASGSNIVGGGGGINNQGVLTVNNSTLSGNQSQFGGGIFNDGTLTLSGCTLSGNSARGPYNGAPADGGGIYNIRVGIYNPGTATLTNCTFSNNSAGAGGGGFIGLGSTATLTNCTFSNNIANTYYSLHVGGALYVSGSATLTNCTLANNRALGGGGLFVWSSGSTALTNCTLSLNSATAGVGGGIFVYRGGILNLTNTIVAGNTARTSGPDISGAVATADHNLVGDATGSSGIVNGVNGNIVGGNGNPVIDAHLGPLQNNGGPTETVALLAGSPAIGHADNSKAQATDQRGVTRIDEAGETTDIGAFEL